MLEESRVTVRDNDRGPNVANRPGVSDETLARSLGIYVGMVDKVLRDPERWLGEDDEPGPDAGLAGRALDAVRDRALGEVTPASEQWPDMPLQERVDWWVGRISVVAGLTAAAPRFAGALADRLPLQAALGASASGLAVCAVAREHGVLAPDAWVPLLAKVLFDRDLDRTEATVPAPEESEQALLEPDEKEATGGRAAALGRGAQHAARTLWRLAGAFRDVRHLLDERPRGGFLARSLAKFPVVGVAGGWLDERGAIQKSAEETERLLS